MGRWLLNKVVQWQLQQSAGNGVLRFWRDVAPSCCCWCSSRSS